MPDKRAERVLAAVGPGDVVVAWRDWKAGIRTPTETSLTFSSQEFAAFEAASIPYWAISHHGRAETATSGANRIENRPRGAPGAAPTGLGFHVMLLSHAFSLLASAIRFRATHAIVDSGTSHWFMLLMLRVAGVQVIPNFHNVIWPVGHPPRSAVRRVIRRLDGLFFRACVRCALGVSTECGRQFRSLAGRRPRFEEYRAQFRAEDFADMPPPDLSARPFRIVFAGRIEAYKGVFDLIEISRRLGDEHGIDHLIEVCGSGPDAETLAGRVKAACATDRFVLHGKLDRAGLLDVYATCHLVIVPTRSDFCEGLPMVCAEAVLAGRPVVTSRLSNALEALDGAVVEAKEDDVADYVSRIADVLGDDRRYDELVRGTRAASAQFIDPRQGLAAAVDRCLRER